MAAASKPETKIVIVSGQEFSVPLDAKEEDLRAHLSSMFPDVASATVQKGKKVIDGVEYQTIEFVKKAGTKGLGPQIAGALDLVPALRVGALAAETAQLLRALDAGQLTIGDALAQNAADRIASVPTKAQYQGGQLCSLLDALTPVAGRGPSAW